jgi:hypothetical protein
MHILKPAGVALVLGILIHSADAIGDGKPAEQPSFDAVMKLVGQLGAADFSVRQDASNKLEKLGNPVIPLLRKAATGKLDVETKRRIELVITRIEEGILSAEEKHWKNLDAPRRGIKDRLLKVVARTPDLSDRQAATAAYLLALCRLPTDDEVKDAAKQLADADGKRINLLRLARTLVQSKQFNADVAAANGRLLKLQADLASEGDLTAKLQRLNGPELQKLISQLAEPVRKAVKEDNEFMELACLMTLSRFAKEAESKNAVAHLKRTADRKTGTDDIFWALLNSREFLFAP